MQRILVISTKPPYPLFHGTAIAVYQRIEHLSILYNTVDLLYMTSNFDAKVDQNMSLLCDNIFCFKINKLQAFLNVAIGFFVNKKPLQVNYYFFSKIKKWIDVNICNYDLVYCNNIRTAEYVLTKKIGKIMDFVDALSMNFERSVDNRRGLWYFLSKIDSVRCLKYEQKILEEFDKCFIISEIDKAYIMNGYSGSKDIFVMENYINNKDDRFVNQDNCNKLVFVGTMNYEPNVTAVLFFLEKIFPHLCKNINCLFYIIGSNPPMKIKKFHNGKNVFVTGFVKDARTYIENSSIVVIPMKSGSGIQNKVLEAMSMRACVVTTSICVAGMCPISNELIIADSDDIMIEIILSLLRDKNRRMQIGFSAEAYVKKYYSKERLFAKFKQYMIVSKL
jgi:glycosyltransferase involved in cell wall biosynthesis